MMWHHYDLSQTVLKTNEPLNLWKSDRGSVDIEKDTLAVALTLDGKPEGYIFGGNGKMILDAIVETDRGAAGKPIERKLTDPFLMVGNPEIMESRSFSAVTEEPDFLGKAQDLYHEFFRGGEHFGRGCHHHHHRGMVFVFKNDSGKLDLLIPHGSKIVYKAENMVFISDEKGAILKSPEHMVVSNHGRCIVMKGRR
jgi:hypothetical protein